MAQIVRVDGENLTIPFDEVEAGLRRALGPDHIMMPKVKRCFDEAGEALDRLERNVTELTGGIDLEAAVHSFCQTLRDWQRGTADWDDIERLIEGVKEHVVQPVL